jgi:hypothetical protein
MNSPANLDVAIDRRGDITVVWHHWAGKRPFADYAVRAVRRLEGGRWGDPVRLSGPLSQSPDTYDMYPQVAMGGGQTTVVWLRPTNEDPCFVMAARRSRGAAKWTAPALLDGNEGCTGPLVAMNRRGDTAATWEGARFQGEYPFVIAAVRPAGKAWRVRRFSVPDPMASELGGVAMDAAGNTTVTWYEYDFESEQSDPRVLAARRPAGGPWEAPTFLSGEGVVASSSHVSAGGQTTTVVWYQSHGLVGAQRTAAATWGEAQTLSNGPPVDTRRQVRVAMDAQAGTVVVWTQLDGATPRVIVTTS